jgi:multidrug transporter EmrE-like cation transporter
MNASKLAGMVLIVAGILGLVYGGFSYTKDTTVVKLGPIELTAKEKETVNVPLWAGVGAIVAGVVLLSIGGRKG